MAKFAIFEESELYEMGRLEFLSLKAGGYPRDYGAEGPWPSNPEAVHPSEACFSPRAAMQWAAANCAPYGRNLYAILVDDEQIARAPFNLTPLELAEFGGLIAAAQNVTLPALPVF